MLGSICSPSPETVQAWLLQCLASLIFLHLIHLVPNSSFSSRQPSLTILSHSALPTLTPPFNPTHLPACAFLTIPWDRGLRSLTLPCPLQPMAGLGPPREEKGLSQEWVRAGWNEGPPFASLILPPPHQPPLALELNRHQAVLLQPDSSRGL